MSLNEIIQSGTNVSITIGANDLLQFANHLIRTTKEELENTILAKKKKPISLQMKQVSSYMLTARPYGDGVKPAI